MEGEYRGFVATSTTRLLKKMGMRGCSLHQAVKSLPNAAGKKQQLAMDQKERQLGCKMKTGGNGTEGCIRGMPSITVKPSEDIVGRRVPT